jgi:hypothetical protein
MGSMPFCLTSGVAISEERNFASDFALSGSLAPAGMIADYTIIFCSSVGIGPTKSTPATDSSS